MIVQLREMIKIVKNSISQYLISKQFLQILINDTNDLGMLVKRVKQMTIFDN